MRRALAALCLLGAAPAPLLFGRFGTIEVVEPATPSGDVALLFAGPSRAELASALAARGALVLALDPATYLAAVRGSSEPCAYPAGELEDLSHSVQQQLARARYTVPVLVGAGDGAALAFAALAQAPPNTFRGALALDYDATLPLAHAPCRGHGLVSHPLSDGRSVTLEASPAPEAPFDTLPKGTTPDALAARFAVLAERTRPKRAELAANVSDLPLVEVPATGPQGDAFALILSGDGGWASLDREVGGALAARGVPVVGWNSLEYYWQARTPEEAAAALERILRHYGDAWGKSRVALVGYSFGADVLPFLASRLPADLRARVAVVALLGPGASAEFEFHFSDWLGRGAGAGAKPIAPEIAKLAGLRVLCVYGREESVSLCRALAPALAVRDERPGDHHFGGDYAAIGARIAAEGKLAP